MPLWYNGVVRLVRACVCVCAFCTLSASKVQCCTDGCLKPVHIPEGVHACRYTVWNVLNFEALLRVNLAEYGWESLGSICVFVGVRGVSFCCVSLFVYLFVCLFVCVCV